jgi:hypothetical protein
MQVQMQLNPNLLQDWTVPMVPVDETPVGGMRQIRVRSDQPLGARRQEYMRMNVFPAEE